MKSPSVAELLLLIAALFCVHLTCLVMHSRVDEISQGGGPGRQLLWKGQSHLQEKPFYDVVILVPSVTAWRDRRDFIRSQFPRNQKLTTRSGLLLFVMSNKVAESEKSLLEEESSSKHDMLFVDCTDEDSGQPVEESSTTCKVLRGIQYISETYDFRYLARVGDDAYFRWDYFLNEVAARLPQGPIYAGRFLVNEKVHEPHIQDHLFLYEYPPYASGMGFVLSADVTHYIAKASKILPFRTGFPEDAIVSLWLIGTTTRRYNVWEFHNHNQIPFFQRPCTDDSILIHYMSPELWAGIDEQGLVSC